MRIKQLIIACVTCAKNSAYLSTRMYLMNARTDNIYFVYLISSTFLTVAKGKYYKGLKTSNFNIANYYMVINFIYSRVPNRNLQKNVCKRK